MKKLKVFIIQSDTAWKQVEKNLNKLGNICKTLNKPDLIVLPEMFTTGFDVSDSGIAEDSEGPTISWLISISKSLNTAITGSISFRDDDGKLFNRQLVAINGEIVHRYDKNHLFPLSDEVKLYTPGTKSSSFDLKGWKIFPQICFDLRFPVISSKESNYDILIYSANWPSMRINHWEVLLQARAIENQCFVLGCNRVGADNYNNTYNGTSMIIDPMGKVLCKGMEKECVLEFNLEKATLDQTRKNLPFLQ